MCSRAAGTWSQQAYIQASNSDAFDYFGESIDVFGDTLVMTADVDGDQSDNSATRSGAAYFRSFAP